MQHPELRISGGFRIDELEEFPDVEFVLFDGLRTRVAVQSQVRDEFLECGNVFHGGILWDLPDISSLERPRGVGSASLKYIT